MSEEEYIRNRLDQININSHYGLMIDTEITKLVRDHMKEKEDNKMNATSTETFHDIIAIDFELQTFPSTGEQDKFIVTARNRDDIFAFEFNGPCLVEACRKAGLLTGLEKDQKIKELEKRNKQNKELANAWAKEYYYLSKKIDKLKEEYEDRIKELQEENENLKKELALEKAANEAHHRFFRQYAGKGTEIEFNHAIRDGEEITYVIVDKERYQTLKDNSNRCVMINGRSYTYSQMVNRILELEALKTPTIENFADEEPADNVNHPSHYTGKYECIDVMQDVFGDEATNDFCLCNAFKYIWRARKKNGLEDVKKAVWYLNKYVEEAEKDGEDEVTGT